MKVVIVYQKMTMIQRLSQETLQRMRDTKWQIRLTRNLQTLSAVQAETTHTDISLSQVMTQILTRLVMTDLRCLQIQQKTELQNSAYQFITTHHGISVEMVAAVSIHRKTKKQQKHTSQRWINSTMQDMELSWVSSVFAIQSRRVLHIG